ncbi:rhodanese-like domain-containing protein [Yoonia sediminilitoris]|nr:rhodanese-like domain-containing protein [Yoonia sediminilitoris]
MSALSGAAAFSCGATHTVVSGDNPDFIQIGLTLEIPCKETSASNPIDWSVMPGANSLDLIKRTASVQILDILSKKAVAKGVIPGAMSVPYSEWRGRKANPGPPPPPNVRSDIIGQAGLRLDEPVIIVHSRSNMMDSGRAAVIYCSLKSSGAEKLAILNGGHKAWVDAGLPVADTPAEQQPYLANITFSDEWRADELDVYGIATGQIEYHLLDARRYSFFRRLNDAGAALATTLLGATNAPVQPLLATLSVDINVEAGVKSVIVHLGRYEPDWK